MSKIGKICCGLAIAFSLGAGILGFMTAQTKTGYYNRLQDSVAATKGFPNQEKYNPDVKTAADEPAKTLKTAATTATKVLSERNQFETDLGATKVKLDESNSQVQKLTTDYTATKKDLDEKTDALTKAAAELQTVSTELKEIKDDLGGRSVKEIIADHKAAVDKAQAIDAEKKIVDDAYVKVQAEVARLKDLLDNKTKGVAPLDMSGRVAAVDKNWNFVVLDIGKHDKLVDGVELTVYRGNQLIGKIRTVDVSEKSAIADVIPELTHSDIQVGDKVLY